LGQLLYGAFFAICEILSQFKGVAQLTQW